MPPLSLLLFGDQTLSPTKSIKGLYHQSHQSVLLRNFLHNTSVALSSFDLELCGGRKNVVSFRDALELAEYCEDGEDESTVVSSTLLCIAQLGSLILYLERTPTFFEDTANSQYLLGLCTGLIPAIAIAAARSPTQLVSMGPDLVCIALRLGLAAQQRSREIEPRTGDWTIAVGKISVEQLQSILDRFNKTHMLPRHRNVYVSAICDRSASVSGPPPTIALLLEQETELTSYPSKKLGIGAAFHAEHLSLPDMTPVFGTSTCLDESLRPNCKIMSTGSGAVLQATTMRDALRIAATDILQLPLRLDLVLDSLNAEAKDHQVHISSFGPCGFTKSVQQALTKNGVDVSFDEEVLPEGLPSTPSSDELIAVVGMAGRFPEGDTLDEFWDVIWSGRDVHKTVPSDRFDVSTHCDPSGKIKNSTLSAFGCFIKQPGSFDTRLFNMSPREAAQTDPVHRLLLMVTYEALELAGYVQDGSPDSLNVGTFLGACTDDYREYNSGQDVDVYYITGGLRCFGPGRLNYYFKWEGPSFSVDTACSSSAAAIDLACQSILSGKCKTAVAGGGNIMTGSNMYAGLSRGGFLSPTGSSKTFDDGADGYCRADAVGVVVLKRLSDAIAAGDNIRGVIRGVGTNHSAYASSITQPHTATQVKLYEKVLRDSRLSPGAVSYVEMHGTGTQAGDTMEMNSVLSTFGVERSASNPLYVGAVKANVGHSEAAAGITSAIKAMLMFQNNVIPPHVGIKNRINAKFPPLQEKNVRIAQSVEKFHPSEDGIRRVWINNFNATGGNTCLVIEEPPRREVQGTDPRSHHVVVVSAKTAYSFRQNQKRLHDFLLAHPETPIEDVAYTTTARKLHHPIRSTYVATCITELIQSLSKDISLDGKVQSAPDKRPIVFSFAGQGSQYMGMGKELFETSSSFRKTILEHEALCTGLGLPSFLHIITETTGDIATASPAQVHCAIVSLGVALAILWMSWGIQPSLVIGHSIGEYCALTIAGVLSLADAFYLVAKRAELIEERCDKNSRIMVVMNASRERLEHLLDSVLPNGSYQVSCINAPESTVVSVSVDVLALLETGASKVGIKTTTLSMPYAFHSSQMNALLEDFGDLAKGVQFHTPQIPMASTLLGELVNSSGTFSASYLVRQTREPVKFRDAVETASATQPNAVWIEHGPNATCAPSIRATLNDIEANVASSLRGSKENCWKTISKTLAQIYAGGVPINWQTYHGEYAQALRLVELPTYAFDLKNYWLQYEGNWALEKNHHQCPSLAEVASAVPVPPILPTFSTTCLHRIEHESFKGEDSSVSFISSLNEPALHELISGHFVNGIGLCPTSVYADMALTAAKYLFLKLNPTKQIPTMDIRDFEIFRPLVLRNGEQGHTVRLLAVKPANSESVQIVISSQSKSTSQDHARCAVDFGDGASWAKSWRRNSYLISDRINNLQSNPGGEAIDTLRGDMVYKIFSEIVDYPESYRGIKKFTMNSALNEAVAKVKFRKTPSGATFTCDPCWIDCIAQVPGFVLNGSAATPPNIVFLSTGWESLRVARGLSYDIEYTCYVRMQKSDTPGVLIGDVSLFEGDEIVAVGAGLRFHEVKKDALHKILPGSRNHTGLPSAIGTQSNHSHETAQKTISRTTARDPVKAKRERSATRNSRPVFETTSLFPLVLQLIAREVGVELEELSDDAIFEDLGIDSLLTISIGTKLKDELQLDLPMALFSQCEKVAQLRDYFRTAYPDVTAGPGYTSDDSPSDDNGEDTGISSATSVSEESLEDKSKSDIVDVIVAVIANETGIAKDDIDPDTDLADLGVDSLMTIAILGVVTAQTGEQLPASVFSDYSTTSALRKGLGKPNAPAKKSNPLSKYASMSAPQLQNEPKFNTGNYKSNVVLLQGDPKSVHPPLFLIADGAGSAASYLKFPHFPSNLPVYAVESPFLHCPFEFTCTIEQICEIFVAAILAKRPHGPYFMGGWSVGGTFAYEAARQLIELDQKVDGVVLIDSPCPRKMDGVISLSLELLEELGMFVGIPTRGGGPNTPMPRGQKNHIMGCVQAVISYEPKPLTPDQRPLCTYIIWSERGMFEQLNDKVREISDQIVRPGEEKVGINPDWLTGTRTSFGPKGWDRLLGDCECHKTEGDHFSCMNMPGIKTTGKLVANAVEKFLSNIKT